MLPPLRPAELLTPRLRLRAPVPGDAERLMTVFGSPEAMRYIGDGSIRSIERVRASIQLRLRSFEEHGVSLFTVERRDSGAVIGDCGVFPIDWKGPEWELAYRYAPDAWGHGYATEAAQAVLDHAWATLPECAENNEIVGVTDPGNSASQRVLGKLGMTDLGTTDRWYGATLRYFRIERPARHRTVNNPA